MCWCLKKENRQKHKGKVLFIDASAQIRVGRAQNFLEKEHVQQIYEWYTNYTDVENFVKLVPLDQIAANDYNLNIPLYIEKIIEDNLPSVEEAMQQLKSAWNDSLTAEEKFKKLLTKYIK